MAAVPSSSKSLRRLTRRAQFLRAARGLRASRPTLALQMVGAEPNDDLKPGVGFTVTKKVGNSPERSRIKRRLRAAVDACETQFRPHFDYVLIGRRSVLDVPFAGLVNDLGALIARVHTPRPSSPNSSAKRT